MIELKHFSTHFRYKNNRLEVEGIQIEKLAKKFGTPLFVYSDSEMTDAYRRLKEGLRSIPNLIAFAVKANSNIHVLKQLVRLGAGLDLVSGGELFRAKKAKCPPDRILFSGIGKSEEEISEALRISSGRRGICSFNVESIGELHRISRIAKKLKKCARVSFRINPNVDAKSHPYISTGLKENKFGITEESVLKEIDNIRNQTSLKVVGVSIHIGSQILDLSVFEEAFQELNRVVSRVEKALGYPLEQIDLGGGMGVPYQMSDSHFPIEKFCELVLKYFGKTSPHEGRKTIILEPGRYISAQSGMLITQVEYIKDAPEKTFVIVDAAMTELLRPSLYQSYHEIIPLRWQAEESTVVDFVGPVCESADFFAQSRKKDYAISAGDFLAILTTGAYGMSMASQYNSRRRPAEILIQKKKAQIIRKRESFQDLIRGEEK